jgi:hypothetical protein
VIRVVRGFAVGAFGAGGLFTGCTDFESAPSQPPAPDASTIDASPEAPDDAGTMNLFANPGFEETCQGAWRVLNGRPLESVPDPHTGAFACKVCRGDAGTTSLYQVMSFDAVPGQSYEMSIWTRTVTGVTAPASLRLVMGFASNDQQDAILDGVPTAAWKKVGLAAQVREPGDRNLQLEVRFNSPSGDCILVDDAVLTRSP